MAKMRFIGEYTNGHTSIAYGKYVFEGREFVDVDVSTDMGRRLASNIEFETVDPLDHDADGKKGGSKAPDEDLSALRAEYQEKMGKRPFPGWDAETLKEKMA